MQHVTLADVTPPCMTTKKFHERHKDTTFPVKVLKSYVNVVHLAIRVESRLWKYSFYAGGDYHGGDASRLVGVCGELSFDPEDNKYRSKFIFQPDTLGLPIKFLYKR